MTLGGLLWPLFWFILGIWILMAITIAVLGINGIKARIQLIGSWVDFDPDGHFYFGIGRLPAERLSNE